MTKKKQQTIEATLGRPKLKTKAPKIRAYKGSSDVTPKRTVNPSGEGSQSWFYNAKTSDSPKARRSPPPPSSFMPPSSSRKKYVLADSSSSAGEASSLDDEDERPRAKATPQKRATPGKGDQKRQSHLSLGSSPRSALVVDDGNSSSDDLPVATPRVSSRPALGRSNKTAAAADDSDNDSDDVPILTPKLARRGLSRSTQRPGLADDSDEDEDEHPPTRTTLVFGSRASAKRTKRARSEDDDDEEDGDVVVHSTKRRRLARKNGAGLSSSPPPRSSPTKRHSKSNVRKEKNKQRELLRRRRAGEDITLDDIKSSEDEEQEHHALYDTDSDHVALEEFEDDDEGVLEPEPLPKSKKQKGKKNKQPEKVDRTVHGSDEDEVDNEMSDFIEKDEDGTIGAPADLFEIPLEFTRHSRKPLKEHFRDVIEWLVRFKFEPNFDEKQNELYMLGWKKLDDEVQALASSKFASSAWKPDFRRALNARPKFVSVELPRGDLDRLFGTCEACGRSGHPATWTVQFEGTAYYRTSYSGAHFLEDVESDEEDESSEESPDSDDDSGREARPTPSAKKERDEDGIEIPPESRQWSVGSVCKSNAETAHTLIHWKHNLLEWVGDRLENDGYMTPAQIAARTKMKRKKKNKMVDAIIAKWDGQRVIESLYHDFKGVLDEARNKSTTGRGGGGWGR